MLYASIILGSLALLVGLLAWTRAGAHSSRMDDLEQDLRRQLRNLSGETEQALTLQRRLMARIAAGESLDPDQIEEGRLWSELSGSEAATLMERSPVHILDVRTPQETSGGHATNAILIPIDELETRQRELPRDKQPLIIYCAAGIRSAAACEFLSSLGRDNLYNLSAGFPAWTGPKSSS